MEFSTPWAVLASVLSGKISLNLIAPSYLVKSNIQNPQGEREREREREIFRGPESSVPCGRTVLARLTITGTLPCVCVRAVVSPPGACRTRDPAGQTWTAPWGPGWPTWSSGWASGPPSPWSSSWLWSPGTTGPDLSNLNIRRKERILREVQRINLQQTTPEMNLIQDIQILQLPGSLNKVLHIKISWNIFSPRPARPRDPPGNQENQGNETLLH